MQVALSIKSSPREGEIGSIGASSEQVHVIYPLNTFDSTYSFDERSVKTAF